MKKTDTLNILYTWGVEQLDKAGVEAPDRTTRDILCKIIRVPRTCLITASDKKIDSAVSKQFKAAIQARKSRIPLQYILGTEEFWGMTLQVGSGVLIPRPESELIVEEVRRCFAAKSIPTLIADLGTGSGNLALALSCEFPEAIIYAVDRSASALRWAWRNRSALGKTKIRLLSGDAEKPIPEKLYGMFSLVVSNPPYIPRGHLKKLQPEIQYEPKTALDGGVDGLRGIQRMLKAAKKLLRSQGVFVCEIGIQQSRPVKQMFRTAGFRLLHVVRDWQKIPRIISGILS